MKPKKQVLDFWTSEAVKNLAVTNIEDEFVKENVAQILENIRTDGGLIDEASQASTTGSSLGNLGTLDGVQSNTAYQFKPITLALVRRTFPELFAHKVVGVQAMNGPVGLAYALRVIYASNNSDNIEAAWENVDRFGGYTGSQVQTSGVLDSNSYSGIYDTSATGAVTSAAEEWTIGPSGNWPQLRTKIDQKSITAATRKLAASFSMESAQDLKVMHGIELERTMVQYLQYEVQAELDREILYRLKKAAVDTTNGGEIITAINVSGTNIDGRWTQEKYANIVNAIIYQSNRIAIKTRRGAGNFVIVSPAIATCIMSLSQTGIFTQNKSAGSVLRAGVAEIGTLNGSITVYRDSYAKVDYALVGYKGPGIDDAGVIFSPYVAALTQRAIHPDDFSARVGVMMRYALTDSLLGSGRYYRLLTFTNVSNILVSA